MKKPPIRRFLQYDACVAAAMRAENTRLKMALEILEKATAYFAKKSQRGTPWLINCANPMICF